MTKKKYSLSEYSCFFSRYISESTSTYLWASRILQAKGPGKRLGQGKGINKSVFILPRLTTLKKIIKPPVKSVETDERGSCANSLFFSSVAPRSHPGDTRALLKHHLLSRGKTTDGTIPCRPFILMPYATPSAVF